MLLALRRRIRHWLVDRLPRSDTWQLHHRNVYILPTPAGWAFGAMLVVNLIATINYQLNLGYMLIFLLFGIGLVSMQVTHRTLRGITLQLRPPPAGFAKEPVPLDIVLAAPARARHGIALEFNDDLSDGSKLALLHTDIPAGGQVAVTLSFTPATRGSHAIPAIRVETRFPFGLFRAWTVWRPSSTVLAWPSPERPVAPWPLMAESAHGGSLTQRREGDEWDGVRAWSRGDPMKRIVWKKVARTGELVSRDTTTVIDRELWFDWSNTQGLDREARLSRLAAWVQLAAQQGLAHGVRLPQLEIAPNLGPNHRVKALNALALFEA